MYSSASKGIWAEVPLLWVSAATSAELGERMRNAGTALKPGG